MAEAVISYPGAKWRFYQHIKQYIPRDIKDWREPFFGGGSMSLSIADDPDFKLERMVGGDLYPEIWAMWTGIRNNPEEVIGQAKDMWAKMCPHQPLVLGLNLGELRPYVKDLNKPIEGDALFAEQIGYLRQAVVEGREFWKWSESVDTSTLSLEQRAARMFLTNRISFSGMGDSGSISEDRLVGFNPECFNRIREASPLLNKMELKNCSFEETMSDVGPDSFVFLDPPYAAQEKSGLYGKNGSTHKGFPHEHFAEVTKNTNCRWFVTYDDSVVVRKLFKGKAVYSGKKCVLVPFTIPGGYTMAGKTAEDALAGEELFILNYTADCMNNNCDI